MKLFWLLLRKDLLQLLRGREFLIAIFGFALLLSVVASLSFRQSGVSAEALSSIFPGAAWLIFLFVASSGLNHSFSFERESGGLRTLLVMTPRALTVFIAKFTSNTLFLLAIQSAVLLALLLLLGVQTDFRAVQLGFVLILVAVGVSAVGTLLSAIATALPGREILLPTILYPLLLPQIAAAVFVTGDVLTGGTFGGFWFTLLCVYDVIFLTLASVFFDAIVRG